MRGQASKLGDTRIAPNKYHYTKTETGWRLTHHIVAEKVLGRPLRYNERVAFKDSDRANLEPNNIVVTQKGVASKEQRKARIRARIAELTAQLEELS